MANLAEANPPVYQYVWRDRSLPGYKALVMTVTNLEGIIGFAFFTALVAYTQARCWILIRDHGLPKLRPFHLRSNPNSHTNNATNPHSLEQLSQVGALAALIGLKESPKQSNYDNCAKGASLRGFAQYYSLLCLWYFWSPLSHRQLEYHNRAIQVHWHLHRARGPTVEPRIYCSAGRHVLQAMFGRSFRMPQGVQNRWIIFRSRHKRIRGLSISRGRLPRWSTAYSLGIHGA